ncbi:MAG: hypothetical protein Kow0081_0540 [Candidatus Dojkabacteria bacterium]
MRFLNFRKKEENIVKIKLTYATELTAYRDKKKFRRNSFAHLRQPPKKKRKLKLPKLKNKINNKVILILFASLILIVTWIFLLNSSLFIVKNINVISDSEIDYYTSFNNLFKDRNLFYLSTNKVEEKVKQLIPNIDYVFARKIFPNTLELEIKIIQPVAYLNSFTFSALFDSEGEIRSITPVASPLSLSEQEVDLMNNRISADSNLIEQTIINSLTEEEIEEFSWEEVSRERRMEVLQELKAQVEFKLEDFKQRQLGATDYPHIFIFGDYDFSNNSFNEEKIHFTLDIINLFKAKNLSVKYSEWITSRTLKISLEDDKEFYFSSLRSFSDQLDSLSILLNSDLLGSGQKFDLRTSTISVI